jgi:hypothetical protein
MLFAGFRCLTKANGLTTPYIGYCRRLLLATEKKVSRKRMVQGGDGGDAFFQRDAFYAAAPWRGLQATPKAQQKVVPVSGAVVGWG